MTLRTFKGGAVLVHKPEFTVGAPSQPSGTSSPDPASRKERPPRERLDVFLSGGSGTSWTFHRMSALPPGVSLLSDGPQPPPSEVQGVLAISRDVPRPTTGWSFARLPQAERDPRHPRFSRVKVGSVVAASEERIDAILNAGASFAHYCKEQADAPEAWSGFFSEWDSAKKLTVQKGLRGDWQLSPSGPSRPTMFVARDVPPWFGLHVRRILAFYARATPVDASPAPVDTNPGWPTFGGTPLVGKLVGCFLAVGQSPDRTARIQRAFCRAVGIPEVTAGAYGLGGRAGPRYKREPLLAFHLQSRSWKTVGEWMGYAQRNRVVYMSAYGQLLSFDRLYRRLRGGQMSTPGLWHNVHPGDVLKETSFADWSVTPSDLSGFDQSVQLGLKAVVAAELEVAWPDLRTEVQSWLRAETLPLITPSVDLNGDMCTVQEMPHGIRSGTKTTSVIGTIINVACALETAKRCGFDIEGWPLSPEWRFFAYGDDALWAGAPALMRRLDVTVLQDVYGEVGLTATLPGGDDFLARHTMPGKGHSPIAARMVQQRCFNEHEEVDATALGRAVLGLVASFEAAELLPPALSAEAWKVIAHADWIRERPWLRSADSLAHARRLCLEHEHELLRQTIATLQAAGELSSISAEADHSPTAAATIALARTMGFESIDPPVALAAHNLGLSIVWGGLSDSARLSMAVDGYRANAEGPRGAGHWLRRVSPDAEGIATAAAHAHHLQSPPTP